MDSNEYIGVIQPEKEQRMVRKISLYKYLQEEKQEDVKDTGQCPQEQESRIDNMLKLLEKLSTDVEDIKVDQRARAKEIES